MHPLSARHAIVATFVLATTAPQAALPQVYPIRPVRIVSPFAAGGSNDVIARTIAPKFTETLGQQFIVENRPGAGGAIGTDFVAKAPADGYTLSIATVTTHAIVATLRKLPYDPVKDFAPIGLIGITPYVIIVHPTLPARTVKQLIALVRARPGQVEFGSGGVGTPGHLAGEMFNTLSNTKMAHVPYKAGNLALNDLLGGHISLTFSTTITATELIKAGRVRALAVTSSKRIPAFPELPTVAESGIPGYEITLWLGLAAPAGTLDSVIQRLSEILVKALQSSDVRSKLSAQSVEPASSTPKEMGEMIKRDLVAYAKITKQSGANAE